MGASVTALRAGPHNLLALLSLRLVFHKFRGLLSARTSVNRFVRLSGSPLPPDD